MIKKMIFALMWVICNSVSVSAQSAQTFEGEIELETFENYSDYIKKMPNSIYFDGVHKMRIIVKGDKMHLIDETTKCHTIADAGVVDKLLKGENIGNTPTKRGSLKGLLGASDAGTTASSGYVHYCEHTKSGMDFTKNAPMMLTLLQQDLKYADGTTASLSANTFAETSTTKNILGMSCKMYEGDINHTMGGMDQKYHVKAYVSDIPTPAGLKYAFYGLDVPGVLTKCAMKYDGGHVSVMNVGELSFYIEMDVTKITPRQVSDDEFNVPSDYKISKSANNGFALMKYFKGIKKELEKRGVKGGDKSQKSTGVHYKTDGEWDI